MGVVIPAAIALLVAVFGAGCGDGQAGTATARNQHKVASSTGIDNGKPGSACVPKQRRLTKPAERGTVANRFDGLYYELGEPTPSRQARGLMLIIHGGGWIDVGPGQVQSMRTEADKWRASGWTTVNLDYRGCARSVADVVAMYDHVRALAGGRPICVEGRSAGGHLALMLAVNRPAIRCVMAFAAPTDLPGLARQRTSPASSALTGAGTSTGPRYSYNLAVAAFGRGQLAALSPALHAHRIRARVLLALCTNDIFIPWAQAAGFAARRPDNTHTLQLPVGKLPFIHGTTTRQGLQEVGGAERELVAGLG